LTAHPFIARVYDMGYPGIQNKAKKSDIPQIEI